MQKKKMFLVDGSSYIYRAFYAITALSNSKGLPTNAIYGFTTMLLKLIKDEEPQYLAVCFDLPGPTFRHKEFAEYKAQRKPTPDALVIQIPWIKRIVNALGIKTLEIEGYEADDIMGTIAKRAEQQGFDVVLVTGDKDMLQLVNPKVSVLRMHRGEEYIYDESKVVERYSVPPDKFADLVGLMGDSSDNIPGVPGIGEKTASRLIREFGDLAAVLNNIDIIKGDKIQKQLRNFSQQAQASKNLATIQTNIPLDVNVEELKINTHHDEELLTLFRELEFNKLFDQIPKEKFGTPVTIEYDVVQSKSTVALLRKTIAEVQSISFAVQTEPNTKSIIALAISLPDSKTYYIPMSSETRGLIKAILESNKIRKTGFDIKQTIVSTKKLGITFINGTFDIILAAYLLTPQINQFLLSLLAITYLGHPLFYYASSQDLALEFSDRAHEFAEQAQTIRQLADVLDKQLRDNQLDTLFANVEMPLVEILAEMETAGIKIDIPYFTVLSSQFEREMEKVATEIYQIAGEEFNINSPKQLSTILFEKLKLPIKKKTKTGYSTNVDVLEELAGTHPLPAKILEYRTLSKMKSTYVDAMVQLAEPKTQLVHTSYHQTGTATGRLSSSEPNLQNIPVQGDWADKIRAGFIPRDVNNVFLSSDYSQIELRILAHVSQDPDLTKIVMEGADIHTQTAAEIFNIMPEMITPEMRRAAKTVNFGIMYGLSPYGLAQNLKINQEEAKAYIDHYFSRYPKVKEYIAASIETARKQGYVTTLFHRRRFLPDIDSPSRELREFSERAAINAPIQGTAADLLKLAMRNIFRVIEEKQLHSLLLLTIHDELVFEVPKSELEIMKKVVKHEMESVVTLSVPIVVSIEVGNNLAEC